MEIVKLRLRDLQPSQFYISAGKLKAIERWLHPEDLSGFQPIPVKLLDGKPVMTDGHTRAVAALRAGLTAVPLVWDEDDLDWDMYRACVKACREKKILSPVDLLTRIIPEPGSYPKKTTGKSGMPGVIPCRLKLKKAEGDKSGMVLGLGKVSDGVMKNHYPKGLRKTHLTSEDEAGENV